MTIRYQEKKVQISKYQYKVMDFIHRTWGELIYKIAEWLGRCTGMEIRKYHWGEERSNEERRDQGPGEAGAFYSEKTSRRPSTWADAHVPDTMEVYEWGNGWLGSGGLRGEGIEGVGCCVGAWSAVGLAEAILGSFDPSKCLNSHLNVSFSNVIILNM
jgi:hypothetical protein